MNPLVKKEIRLLLPAWIAAMVLVVFSPWISVLVACLIYTSPDEWIAQGGLHFWLPLAAFGFLFLGLTSFGQEFSSGTFSTLLSQPMERGRLWQIKITTLALAFVSVWVVALLSGYTFCVLDHWTAGGGAFWTLFRRDFLVAAKSEAFEFLTLSILVTFTGGLWTTLLLRQTTGAFWFTLLAPCAICLGIGTVLTDWFANINDSGINKVIIAALLLYSIAGFALARRLFFRAQDAQWTGGEISFPWLGKIFERDTALVSARPGLWLPALARKEIHLQQANILIAAIVLALNLFSLLLHKIHPHFENPDVQIIFEVHWMLWLLMPLLIGSVAIAEERKLGILETQLCLPVSRRTQLFVKFSVALILSLFLGGGMPLLLEGTKALDPFYAIFIVAGAIFIPSFYSSSVVRTTLQAIGLAIFFGLAIIVFEAVSAFNILRIGRYSSSAQLGLELLKLYLGPPILLLTLGWLTLWNFEWLHENRKRWRRNLLTLAAAFASIFILINGIYFRGWELFMPAESRGPARLEKSTPVAFAQNYNTLYATLPNGRLWADTLAFQNISNRWWESTVVVPNRCRAQFLAGSNWVQVAADNFQALGIQSDGTLWSLQRHWNPSRRRLFQTGSINVTRLGPDTDWLQVASGSMGFLALKKDGSLWVWGNHQFSRGYRQNTVPQKFKADLGALPVRVGNEANYTGLLSSSPSPYAIKTDGRWWTRQEESNHVVTMILETNLNNQWSNWTFSGDSWFVGVKTNGELWYYFTENSWPKNNPIQRHIQLGRDAKWKTATFAGDAILAMRDDGTLWSWSPRWDLGNNQNSVNAVQLGNHSDWIALTGDWTVGLALAPDGNLYAWDQPSHHIWLAPSRRPLCVGNIFEGAQ
jgi:ABC-type transport system involved in multi-copper enzyme maturation permease subunit